jgi:hypothetical protein
MEAASADRVLVDATDFLLRDAVKVIPTLRRANQGSYALDKSRSVFYWPNTKNFPQIQRLKPQSLSRTAMGIPGPMYAL